MRLLNLFGKRTKDPEPPENKGANEAEESAAYSGMRVEVTTFEGHLLFVAKLMELQGSKAELHQYSETGLPQEEGESLHVKIRGYNDHCQKAVYMEGVITPMPKHIWQVEELTVTQVANDRAFFRLSTNLDATATMFSGLEKGERPCKMLNISAGGACISSKYRYHKGDKFLLKVKMIEDRPESVLYCQVLRVIEKDDAPFEYGCQFLELTEDDQSKIVQNIFAVQRQKRVRPL
ncbi:MAG: PilZ domain-containing protein [Provencibacterium sp.]|nr:PilZ domain-containing protein [Provencibacterium sp.]